MAVILAIETATRVCSVALFDGEKLLALKEEQGEYRHSEKLNVFIGEAMAQAGVPLKKIDAVAIGEGPGSYTGLRIGVSAAKGLCYALNKPLLAVNTLSTMAAGAREHIRDKGSYYLCPMIDARRMEVYAAVFNEKPDLVKETSADIIDRADYYSRYTAKSKFYFFGDGAGKCRELFKSEKNMEFLDIAEPLPSARHMGKTALKKYLSKQFEDVAYFEPFYLKDFITTKPKG